jgi:hypothetical protein
MTEAVAAFKLQFKPTVAAVLNEVADALDDVENEQITKFVPPAAKK